MKSKQRRRRVAPVVPPAGPVTIKRADGTVVTRRAKTTQSGTRFVQSQERAAAKRGAEFWDHR